MLRLIRQFRTSLSALLLSAALAAGGLAGTAAPARADAEDAARIIAGIIALYGISRAIEMHNDRRDPPRAHAVPTRPRHLVAPARCFIDGHDRNGYFRGYVRRCMQHNARHPQYLPASCLRRVHTPRGERMIYAGRCLAQNGWVRQRGFNP
jgi:hypothetical protein